MELVDGLSMLYSTAVAIFSVFSIHLSTVGSAVLAVGIFTLVTAVSIGQYAYPNPTLHGICFGGMVLMFLGRCIQLRRRVVKLRPEMDGPLVRLLGIGSGRDNCRSCKIFNLTDNSDVDCRRGDVVG